MRVTIVYDNEALTEGLASGWGFSAFIECDCGNLLFDAGWDPGVLAHNLDALKIGFDSIDYLALSHWHWDHIGGVPLVLSRAEDIRVFLPASFSDNFVGEVEGSHPVEKVSEAGRLLDGVLTTGELFGRYKDILIGEQSLGFETSKGIVLVVGCSHPGLGRIISEAGRYGRIRAVIGGFHGFGDFEALKGIDLIVPTHCTQRKKDILSLFGGCAVEGGAGWSMQFK